MYQLTSALCWLVLGTGLLSAPAERASEEAPRSLQGAWVAVTAVQDGKPATDVVGHRLSFRDSRFRIQRRDGKLLYEGAFQVEPGAKPPAIDFRHAEGELKGKTWKGIYRQQGDILTICDNAPLLAKDRPRSFEAGPGSGYVLITFKRLEP